MPKYRYEIQDNQGLIVKGLVEAVDENSIITNFKDQGYLILYIEEEKENILEFDFSKYFSTIKKVEIVNFSIQLSTMLESGITLLDSLSILEEQIENKKFKNIISSLIQNIENGMSFYEALSKHPNVFSRFYIYMIKIGETGGILQEILNKVTEVMENEEKLKQDVKSALTYPIVLIFVGISVVIFLLKFVLPKFTKMFSSKNQKLPEITEIMISISNYFSEYFFVTMVSLAIFTILSFLFFYKTEIGKYLRDYLLIKLPLFGILIKKGIIARFSLLMAALLKSGVTFLDAVEVVEKILNNKIIEKAVSQMKLSVQSGSNISEPLLKTGIFPIMVTKMIKVGEQSGNLDSMLFKVAAYYEREIKIEIKKIISLIEPILIINLAFIVGFILLSVFLPLLDISKTFK
jgi:type IV pilus assembly protein PilC